MSRRIIGVALLAAYIYATVLANWLTTHHGLITVFPGLRATAGTVVIGVAIMSRDFVQDALGKRTVFEAICAGAFLSYITSSHQVAAASGITFLIAESLEALVYTPLRERAGWGTPRWVRAVIGANGCGALLDTFLFLGLAGFPLTAGTVAGQLVGKAYVTAGVLAMGVILRRALLRQSVERGCA